MRIRLSTLGQIDIRTDEAVTLDGLLAQPKRVALLAYLAGCAPRLCRRDTLVGMFWPDSDDERARAALRKALHFIRHEAGDVLASRGADEVGLRTDLVWVDAVAFEEHVAAGRMTEALDLYGGDFLPGFFIRGAPAFERWLELERARLRQRASEAAWSLADSLAARGDLDGARAAGVRALDLSPDDEIAVRKLITMLVSHGDRAGAISVYQSFASRLAADLEIEPSRETRALIESVGRPDGGDSSATFVAPAHPPIEPTNSPVPAELSPKSSARTGRWAAGALIAVAVIAVAAYGLRSKPAAAEPGGDRIALFPFLVSGGTDTKYLQDGLPILLGTRLDGAGSLRTIDPRATLLDISRDGANANVTADRAIASAERLGARFFVLGTVVGSAKALHFDVGLYDRSTGGTRVARAEVGGSESDLMGLVDRVAASLLAGTLHDAQGSASETAALTSTSIDALKAWLRGESALVAGRYIPAMDAFRAAIEADSTFAMAHYRLALAANWAGEMALVNPSSQRALDYSARLKPSERATVVAFWHARRGHYAVAESLYRSVLVARPASVESWYDLAEVLYHGNPQRGRPIADARAAFEQVLRLDRGHFASMVHLARLAAARRDVGETDRLTSLALKGEPDGTHRAELLLLRAIILDDRASEDAFLRAPHTTTDMDAFWRAAEYTGDMDRVATLAQAVLRDATTPELRASLRLLLAHVEMGREQFGAAAFQIDSLSRLSPNTGALTRALYAIHPALPGDLRKRALAGARAALASPRDPRAGPRIYVGSLQPDQSTPYFEVYEAVLAMAAGDTSGARRLMAIPDHLQRIAPGRYVRQWISLSSAGGRDERLRQLEQMAAFDLDIANRHVSPSPLVPRALAHLAAARVLDQEERSQEGARYLSAVPEDLGFNIAFLRELERRRSGLNGGKR